jgi:hypothetical protein
MSILDLERASLLLATDAHSVPRRWMPGNA